MFHPVIEKLDKKKNEEIWVQPEAGNGRQSR
jgi:hypothetical protein